MRRILSIIFFVIGGIFLQSEGMMAFASLDPDVDKLVMMAFFLPFVIVPLGLAVAITPGNRPKELGLVMLISAAWLGFSVFMVIYMIAMPDTRVLFPPEVQHAFEDYVTGGANLLAMTVIGWLLFSHGRKAGAAAAGKAIPQAAIDEEAGR